MPGDGWSRRRCLSWCAVDPSQTEIFLDICNTRTGRIRRNQIQVADIESLGDNRRAGFPCWRVPLAGECPEVLQCTGAKAGFPLKFDQLGPGHEGLVSSVEMNGR